MSGAVSSIGSSGSEWQWVAVSEVISELFMVNGGFVYCWVIEKESFGNLWKLKNGVAP